MRALALTLATCASILAAGSAEAAPVRDALIRPGVGIGEIRLGMRLAEVRRALGRPQVILEQRRLGFGSSYSEYAWNGANWTVGLLGRGDRARVVSVATGLRRERTRSRVSVGSTDTALRRALGTRCYAPHAEAGNPAYARMTCYLGRSSRAPNTVFRLYRECTAPEIRSSRAPSSRGGGSSGRRRSATRRPTPTGAAEPLGDTAVADEDRAVARVPLGLGGWREVPAGSAAVGVHRRAS